MEWIDDDELMAELATVVARADPVPSAVTDAARGAFTWRRIDEELAVLSFDSAVDELVGMRGAGDRQLAFEADGVTIELEVVGGTADLVGQVLPAPSTVALEIQFAGAPPALVPIDEYGLFTASARSGPFRLLVRSGGRPVATEWVTL